MLFIPLGINFYMRRYKRKFSLLKRQFMRYYPDYLIFLVVFICIFAIFNVGFFIASVKRILHAPDGKIDWHDWKLIDEDDHRTGLGEHGEAAYLSFYPDSTKQVNDTHGFNGYLSDRVALNRSLKDLRPAEYVQCFALYQFNFNKLFCCFFSLEIFHFQMQI